MNPPPPDPLKSSLRSWARRVDEDEAVDPDTVERASAQETDSEPTGPYQPGRYPATTAPGQVAPSNGKRWPAILGYEILDEVGKGGMGMVYRARQLSANRIVALKVIRGDKLEGLAPEQRRDWLHRFQTEAQAAARVSHEHVVAVYEVGESEGQPFYSMRYVEGRSLAQILREGLLTNHRAAAYVEQVARAIHGVHLCGVLHRDIKPGNILVERNDRPLVTDFGLAKWVDGETGRDQTRGALGTPDYMSPEQATDGARATTASDVYSLGATLYALLTGRPPFQAAEPLETMRQVIDKDPVPPRLNPAIARDLETISLKCLHKEPGKRYGSAEALAEDLRRFREGQPILARPVGSLERAAKWVRRNKAMAAFLIAAAILVWGGIGAGFWYQDYLGATARKKVLNEQAVRHSLDQARSIHDNLLRELKKPGGVQELLNQRVRYHGQIQLARASWQHARDLSDQAEVGFDPELSKLLQELDTELTRAQTHYDLAVRLEKIRTDRAAWVEGTFDYKRAGEEYPRAFAGAGLGVVSDDPEGVVKRIMSMPIKEQVLAALDDWAWAAWQLGSQDMVEKLLAAARAAAPDPAWADRLRQAKTWRNQEALTALANKAPPAGLSPQLLVLLGELLDKENPRKQSWLREARARFPADFWLNFDLGAALRHSDPVEAAGFYRVALTLRPNSSAVYNNLGNALADQKKLPEAIAAYHQAIALDPKLAFAYCGLGIALHAKKELPEAIAAFRKAIAVDPNFAKAQTGLGHALSDQKKLPEAIAAYHQAIALNPKYAMGYYNLGVALRAQQKLPEAIAAFRKAIALDPEHAIAYNNLGDALACQQKVPEAIAAYHQAIALEPKFALAYYNLGSALTTQKKLLEAVAAYHNAIALDPKLAVAYYGLGVALYQQRKLPEAVTAYRQAIALDPQNAKAYDNLGLALYGQRKLPEAIAAFRKAIALEPRLAQAHTNLGVALADQRKLPEAIAAYHKAIALDPQLAKAYYNLGNALRAQRKLPEAIAAFRKTIEVNPTYAEAHCNLGDALLAQGEMAQGLAALRRGDEVGRRQAAWMYPSAAWVRNAERLARLEWNLPAIVSGTQQPASARETIQYVEVCHLKRLYAAAARLYQQAFAADQKLAEDLKAGNRYNGARAACLAAAGQGKDSAKLDDKQRAHWRQQAVAWLNADLALWTKELESGKPQDRATVQQTLSHWEEDADLAGIREAAALAKLPAVEQAACHALWADVAALLKKAGGKP